MRRTAPSPFQVESFQLVHDWTGGYEIETQVTTGAQAVPVVAVDSLNGGFQTTVSGLSNLDLILTF